MEVSYRTAGNSGGGSSFCSLDFFYHCLRPAASHIDLHTHPTLEIVYYGSGAGETRIGDRNFAYGPGTFAVIPPHVKHNEYRHVDTEVLFACFFFDRMVARLESGLYADTDRRLESLMRAMSAELAGKRKFYDLTLQGLLCQAVAEIGRLTDSTAHTGARNGKVAYALRYIEQYLAENIDLQALAGGLGYSYDHFRHLFKLETGYAPTQFILRQRVEKAKLLLRQPDHTITEIAERCGFGSAAQFSMVFGRQTGISPRTYRKNSHFR